MDIRKIEMLRVINDDDTIKEFYEGDIVSIAVTYSDRLVKGRIRCLSENYMRLDCSEKFNEHEEAVYYNTITEIKNYLCDKNNR